MEKGHGGGDHGAVEDKNGNKIAPGYEQNIAEEIPFEVDISRGNSEEEQPACHSDGPNSIDNRVFAFSGVFSGGGDNCGGYNRGGHCAENRRYPVDAACVAQISGESDASENGVADCAG